MKEALKAGKWDAAVEAGEKAVKEAPEAGVAVQFSAVVRPEAETRQPGLKRAGARRAFPPSASLLAGRLNTPPVNRYDNGISVPRSLPCLKSN